MNREPDYGEMTKEESNYILCWLMAHIESEERKISALLVASICQSIALTILIVKLFLL